jgi:ADP-ribose pyrophosphatase YjhB (NUDIX family)
MPLPADIEPQITSLSARYGTPTRATVPLREGSISPLTKPDRVGEVCMVVRRPNGLLLTARKHYYPPGIHRLLTGGINHGEPIEDALRRETYEETSLDTIVRRFLAVVEYSTPPHTISFFTCAFLLDETGGTLQPQDDDEDIATFHEVAPTDLPTLADHLEAQTPATYHPEIQGNWNAWGHFRAAAHRVIAGSYSVGWEQWRDH